MNSQLFKQHKEIWERVNELPVNSIQIVLKEYFLKYPGFIYIDFLPCYCIRSENNGIVLLLGID